MFLFLLIAIFSYFYSNVIRNPVIKKMTNRQLPLTHPVIRLTRMLRKQNTKVCDIYDKITFFYLRVFPGIALALLDKQQNRNGLEACKFHHLDKRKLDVNRLTVVKGGSVVSGAPLRKLLQGPLPTNQPRDQTASPETLGQMPKRRCIYRFGHRG